MTLPELLDKWTPVLAMGGWPAGPPDVGERGIDVTREVLRVRVQHRALVGLLVNRGVITQAQYDAAVDIVATAADAELTARFPKNE